MATCLPLAPHHIKKMLLFHEEIQLIGILFNSKDYFFALDKHSVVRTKYNFFFLFVFSFFPETKAKGLASSWRIYFRTLGIDHHGFLQNIWNQAHETCLLNWSKQDTCVGCYFGFLGITCVLCMWIMVVLKHCVYISLLKVLLKPSLLPLFLERF